MIRCGSAMNDSAKRLVLAVAGALLLATALRAGAEEANAGRLAEARIMVEKSSLPREAKTGILSKADKAVSAGIPADDVAIIVSRGLKQGVPAAQLEGLLETTTAVKARNLPVRLVLERIELGLAKGVPAERIAGVSRKLSENLETARPIVEKIEGMGLKSDHPERSDSTVETVAKALEKSIPRDAIMRTGEKVRDQKGSLALFDRAMGAMSMFVGNGMSSDHAARIVNSAVDRGYSEHDLDTMERYMAEGLRNNRSMSDVASGMESRMNHGTMRDMHERQGGGMMGGPGSGSMGGGGSGMKDHGGMMR